MSQRLYTIDTATLENLSQADQQNMIYALENEQILFFPTLSVDTKVLTENNLWSDSLLDSTHKNVSYQYTQQKLGLLKKSVDPKLKQILPEFMKDYATFAKNLVDTVLPSYRDALIFGRTSYRPAKINQKVLSKRKDDTQLHVDSFSASPVYGKRILRVFTNINPFSEPRVWHIGEPFLTVLNRYAPKIPRYNYWAAQFLKLIKSTKTLRSPYDHYQIYLHDRMKRDEAYQHSVAKEQIDFPAGSTWMVFTDQVSHAALGGQFLLEQTFYLPISAMNNPELSPFKHWERAKSTVLSPKS